MEPDYQPIEVHIRRARLQRSVYLARIIADGIFALGEGFRALTARIKSHVRTRKARPDQVPQNV